VLRSAPQYPAVQRKAPVFLVLVSSDGHHAPASATEELTLSPRNRQGLERPGNECAKNESERQMAANVVLKGTTVHGNIMSPDDVMVDGTIYGEVRGLQVWIGRDASVEGTVVADRVTVEGTIRGPIFAGHVHLGAASKVNGDLCSDNITIDKGAMLTGRVWPSQSPSLGYPRPERLSREYSSPINLSVSAPKALEPAATEKSPPIDRGEQKDR
jgi:cytoskeletal protein CcmA (bactofilin family)